MMAVALSLLCGIYSECLLSAVRCFGNDTLATCPHMIFFVYSTTIYDYDSKVSDKMVYLCRRCFPLKTMPTHICCANPIIVRILKPLMKALMNKEARQRFLMHDAPPSGILGVLSKYGITKYVLPTEMGGEIQLDQIEWIACRRAIEMEEIG